MRTRVAILIALILTFLWHPVQAREIRLMDGERVLLGKLAIAKGKTLADGVLVMLHGTLAHLGQETIVGVQRALTVRKISTLAITLSLGESARKGMYTCEKTHRHKHSNAVREIALWHKWLRAQGVKKIALFGHSRGGNQSINYARSTGGKSLAAVIALAPSIWSVRKADATYSRRFKRDRLLDVRAARRRGEDMLEGHPFYNCPKARVRASTFVDYHRNDPSRDTPSLLVGYRGPSVLVIAGREDTVVPSLIGRMARVKNPTVSFVVVEDANHMFLDFFAEDVADKVAAFLKGKM